MIRFIFRILLVTLFFIGLGGIADTAIKNMNEPAKSVVFEQQNDCPRQRIKLIKFNEADRPADQPLQFRLILPNIDEMSKTETGSERPTVARKIVIIKQSPSI